MPAEKGEKKRARKPAADISEKDFEALLKRKIGGYKMRKVYNTSDAQIVNVFFLASL